MTPLRFRSHVAVLALLALATTILAPAVEAQALSSFSGKVFAPDGRTPRTGVVVSLVDDQGAQVSTSTPTSDEGSFVIDQASPGSYHLLIEAPEGAFLAGELVEVAPGSNRPVSLTLQTTNYQQSQQGLGKSGGGLPAWAKWLIAGGIIVGGLLLINEINSDDDPPASPIVP